MISKSVIVFWSVASLTIFVHLVGKHEEGTAYYILFLGLLWAIVVAPTALIGKLFRSQKVYGTKMRVLRGGVLTALGLLTFVIVHASQQPKRYRENTPAKDWTTIETFRSKQASQPLPK
jgi:hypothetical protein